MLHIRQLLKHTPGKKLTISAIALAFIGTFALSFVPSRVYADCNDNYITHCSVSSASALESAYNKDTYVQHVYTYFGISKSDITGLGQNMKTGTVTKSGDIIVDGKTVATGAITAGRDNITGSTKVTYQGSTFYTRPPSVSFQQNSLSAWIVMKNNQFAFAILPSCGNPVKATPKPAPKPQPSAQCTNLTLDKLDTLKYRATVQVATKNGAEFKDVTFTFGDNTGKQNVKTMSLDHTYKKAGTYKVSATVFFSTSTTTVLESTCTASTTATVPPTPTPPKPPTTTTTTTPPTQLLNTGPGSIGSMVGIFAGTTAVGAAAYRWRLTRNLDDFDKE